MEDKQMPGFMTYREAALMFSLMGKEAAADAIVATCRYFLFDEIPELEGITAQVFDIQKAAIDRGRAKYEKQVEAGRSGGNKSAEARKRQP